MTLLFNHLTFTFKKDHCNRNLSTLRVAIAAIRGSGSFVAVEQRNGLAVAAEKGFGAAEERNVVVAVAEEGTGVVVAE